MLTEADRQLIERVKAVDIAEDIADIQNNIDSNYDAWQNHHTISRIIQNDVEGLMSAYRDAYALLAIIERLETYLSACDHENTDLAYQLKQRELENAELRARLKRHDDAMQAINARYAEPDPIRYWADVSGIASAALADGTAKSQLPD